MNDIVWILLAAGNSARFGKGSSKLLETIPSLNAKVIDVTLSAINQILPDSRILLVSSEEFRDESGYVGEWVQGGDKRQDSARNGVLAVDHADAVLIHDAARPFISSTLVHSLLSKLESCDAVAPGIRVTDTIKRVIDTKVVETLDRNHLFRLQTPQVIKYDVAVKAFTSLNPSQTYTDDLAVVEAMGGDVHIIEGDTANIKITHQSDITIASQLGSERPSLSQ